MRNFGCVVLAFAVLSFSGAARADMAANKKTVVDFYNAAINDKDFDKARNISGPVRPAQSGGGGRAGGAEGLPRFPARQVPQRQERDQARVRRRRLRDLHVHAVREPGTRGNAIVDIFSSRTARWWSTGT